VKSVKPNLNPLSTFPWFDKVKKEKTEISYADYYKNQYSIEIKDLKQPLLEHEDRKTKRTIYLIPELCKMTGLSDSHRKDFRLMKEMAKITHKSAGDRLKESKEFFELIKENEQCKELMEDFEVDIDPSPVELYAKRLFPANFVMSKTSKGARIEFPSEGGGVDVDTKIQQRMYLDIKMNDWWIIYPGNAEREKNNFLAKFKTCTQNYKFPIGGKPKELKMEHGQTWIQAFEKLKTLCKSRPDMVICLFSGKKVGDRNYNEAKRYALTKMEIATQFVNVMTISKGKNLISICNRILMQINAKLGGAPWAIAKIPYEGSHVMVMGVNVWKDNKLQKSLLNITATVNPRVNISISF
jgi:aubergine